MQGGFVFSGRIKLKRWMGCGVTFMQRIKKYPTALGKCLKSEKYE
jgi:hypothetical protein